MILLLPLLGVVTASVSANSLVPETHADCSLGCSVPSSSLIWLAVSSPPCVHPGQPILQWPPATSCLSTDSAIVRSSVATLDKSGLLLAERRLCFVDHPVVVVALNVSCDERRSWREREVRLAHPQYAAAARDKRWLRRRNPPQAVHFQQDRYVKEVREDIAVGSVVLRVKASHANRRPLFYSMQATQDSRSHNIFTLDTESGEIQVAKSLDREALDRHVLKVTAADRLEPLQSASATVVIDVTDVQDNSPIFERDSYFADIREDAPIGTTVLSVFARDVDAGENGEVEYSLETVQGEEEGEGAATRLLSIHPKLGVIQTAAILDRERQSMLRIAVVARDKGDPPRNSSALIQITLVDVNDNSPVFDKPLYNVSILENSSLPAVVAVVHAVDADAGVNGEVHYSLASSSTLPVTVDYSSGEVLVRGCLPLSRLPLSLLVRAKDGAQPARSSTVTLLINVIDINDHAPLFVASQRQLSLEEGVGVGEEVGRVMAVDDDLGENGQVTYSLNGTNDFVIDPHSGVIRTAAVIDRETVARYEIVISASDAGSPPQSSSTEMSIIVRDVNDNSPVFPSATLTVSLSEDAPRGTRVAVVKATDADEQQKLVYRIEKAAPPDLLSLIDLGEEVSHHDLWDSGEFTPAIICRGALLSVASSLAGHTSIEVIVTATDASGLSGRVRVAVLVDDVNSPPAFLPHPLSVHVNEDAPLGLPVLTMTAEDSDRGGNAAVKYSLSSSDGGSSFFSIDNSTGAVAVATALDRESQATFFLTVTATDSATPPLSASSSFEIIVDDVNDNTPQFTSLNYTAAISEDIAIGTSFLQISASDVDEGENALIDYFLNESSAAVQADLFRLDRTSGTLRVNGRLDRETFPRMELAVSARDRGRPSLSSTSLISISLLDVDDNAPVFEFPAYEFAVAENSPPGSVVGSLTARDADEDANARIQFRIFGGADAELFDILVDEDTPNVVKILTRTTFDYEAKNNQFHIEIQATGGQLSSTVAVRVRVSDVNDNAPQLADFIVLVAREEAASMELPFMLGRIPAFDPDQNATLEYSLDGGSLLAADRETGRISLLREWHLPIDTSFKACVSDGPNTVCSSCRFIFSPVSEEVLDDSLTLRLSALSVDAFLHPVVFTRFRQSLSTLSVWRESSIQVFSVSAVAEQDAIDVSFFVIDRQRVVKWRRLRELVESELSRIEASSLLAMRIVAEEACGREPCPYFQQCRHTLKMIHNHHVRETDNFISLTLKTMKTFVCECPPGFSTSPSLPGVCNIRVNECFSSPCLHNATCTPLENSFRCDCTLGWQGDCCEIPETAVTCVADICGGGARCAISSSGGGVSCQGCKYADHEADGRCRLQTLSFDGNGFVVVEKQLTRMQWTLELRFATIAHEGVLLFAGSGDRSGDFVEVAVEKRLLRAEFSLGGEKARQIKMRDEKRNRVNDGEWHSLRVVFYNRELTMTLDDCDAAVARSATGAAQCSASAAIPLPPKCADPTVPCFRFLDVPSGIVVGARSGKGRRAERPFQGCVANLTLDGSRVFFDHSSSIERIGDVNDGCPPLRRSCQQKQKGAGCGEGATCVERWSGVNCRCHHSVHDEGGRCTKEHPQSFSLQEEESFLVWRPSSPSSSPVDVSFDFRTSRSKMQILAIQFDRRHAFLTLHLDDGVLRVWLGSANSTAVPAPELRAGVWVGVQLQLGEEDIRVVVDGLYSASLPLSPSTLPLSLHLLSAGIAPSTNHPSPFEGCIRNLRINGEATAPSQSGKTRHGCVSSNRCELHRVCPLHSRCIREWDRHRCQCLPGFAGDTCLDVCSVRGVCGEEGGVCQRANNSLGYECICPPGRWGANCEWEAPTGRCPSGWFGRFPECLRCACDAAAGFVGACDAESGECRCPPAHFASDGACVPCGCAASALSPNCLPSGTCICSGQATGRRCDRCVSPHSQLNESTLQCSRIVERCPSLIEADIQWPQTKKGRTARVACPSPQTGIATRKCSEQSTWEPLRTWNCTRPEYNAIVAKLGSKDWLELAGAVVNATGDGRSLTGRNLLIARDAIFHLLTEKNGSEILSSVQDHLAHGVIVSAALVASQETGRDFLAASFLLFQHGVRLQRLHSSLRFLQPFQATSQNILFAVDEAVRGRPLPKFDNFVDLRGGEFPTVQLEVQDDGRHVFYMVLRVPAGSCSVCESALAAFSSASPSHLRISFPLIGSGWSGIVCSRLLDSLEWSQTGSTVISVNRTHAECEFSPSSGIFALTADPDSASFVHLRLGQGDWLLPGGLHLSASLVLLLSLLCALCRRDVQYRLIRVAFPLSLIALSTLLFILNRSAINQVFCPVRNGVLSLLTAAPFAWLFLFALQLYRLLADGQSECNALLCLLLGVVVPCLLSSLTFFLSPSCALHLSSTLFWLILSPIALFVLLSFYASATSFLISCDKNYDVFMVKGRLRRALFQHACLMALTTVYVCLALFSPLDLLPLADFLPNVLFAALSVLTLYWTSISSQGLSSPHSKASFWMAEDVNKEDEPCCQSPLLKGSDDQMWMPDVIPALQSPLDRPPPSILSPATHILASAPHASSSTADPPPPPLLPEQAHLQEEDDYYSYNRNYDFSTFSRRKR